MASSRIDVHLLIEALVGTAECMVCATLVSFRLQFSEIDERIDQIHCPRCKASCMPNESSLVLEVRTVPAP